MNRSSLLTGLIASTAILISASAHAAIVVTVGGVAGPAGQTSSFAPTTFNFNVAGTFPVFTPAAGVVTFQTGSGAGVDNPSGDTTQFASVGTAPNGSVGSPAIASINTIAAGTKYVGLYWGSLDTYNTLSITDSSGTYDICSSCVGFGSGVLTPGGTISQYVNISDTLDITKITFKSTGVAFEFDNLTLAGAVPEASTWAMMILGFLGVGFFGYRKSSKSGAAFRIA